MRYQIFSLSFLQNHDLLYQRAISAESPAPHFRYNSTMSSVFRRRKQSAEPQSKPFETLANELLHAILEHVQDTQDQLSLCLVSRRFYISTVELLYRNITIQFAAASHRQLWRRLTHPTSHIPARIRVLRISWSAKSDGVSMNELFKIFRGTTNLRRVVWCGPLDIQHYLSIAIRSFSLQATIEIQHSWPATREKAELAMQRLSIYPYRSHVTHLHLHLSESVMSSADLKKHLLKALKNSQALIHVRFSVPDDLYFPEYAAEFDKGDLPKLKHLDLGSSKIFTADELERWGKGGGWSQLQHLCVCRPERLYSFVGSAPNLTSLYLYIFRRADLVDMDMFFAQSNDAPPFPKLQRFYCEEITLLHNTHYLPLRFLQWMPGLTSLTLLRRRHLLGPQAPDPAFPEAADIRKIRLFCPGLEKLDIEIDMNNAFSLKPSDIYTELCKFEKPIYLHLNPYVHIYSTTRADKIKRFLGYFCVGRKLLHMRRQLGLPHLEPCKIGFTSVEEGPYNRTAEIYPDMEVRALESSLRTFVVPFYYFDDSQSIDSFYRLDRMTVVQLEGAKMKYVLGKPVGKRKRVVQELERRKRDEDAVVVGEEYPTLYDAWTQETD